MINKSTQNELILASGVTQVGNPWLRAKSEGGVFHLHKILIQRLPRISCFNPMDLSHLIIFKLDYSIKYDIFIRNFGMMISRRSGKELKIK